MNTDGALYRERRSRILWFAAGVLLIADGCQRLATGDAAGWTIVFPVAEVIGGVAALVSVVLGLRAARKNSETRTQGAS